MAVTLATIDDGTTDGDVPAHDRFGVEGRRAWWRRPEPLLAVAAFLGLCVIVLTRATALLEPDDYAYRASIAALANGHILLTNAQYVALNHQLAHGSGQGIVQWHRMASGKWISEKNPGYPLFAVLFYVAGLLRLAPLFYGGLACVGLYLGARAWLGKWAGTYCVWLYCFSGAALVFAWRATMPTFTDASLIAAGFGALLWTALRPNVARTTRTLVGLAAFACIEAAVFIRYTNVVELIVATIAVVALRRACRFTWRTLSVWLTSVVATLVGIGAFNLWAYGHATSTGYSAGEITFSWSALWPNLKGMPTQLTTSMPMWILAAVALTWIALRFARRGALSSAGSSVVRRDALVAVVLALGWLAMWGLYLTYTWTANMVGGGGGPGGGGNTVHVIRFYLPVLGLIALLATWLVVRLARPFAIALIGAIAAAALLSFTSMSSGCALGAGPGQFGPSTGTSHAPSGAPFGGQPPSYGSNGRAPRGRPPTGHPPGSQF